jgi:hypothetical protein
MQLHMRGTSWSNAIIGHGAGEVVSAGTWLPIPATEGVPQLHGVVTGRGDDLVVFDRDDVLGDSAKDPAHPLSI